jgi:hypothetical protein
MPAFIPARGRTPHLAGVCVNRIGTEFSPDGASYTMLDVRRKQYEDRVRSFAPLILELRSKGMSFHQIAEEFNRRQFVSRRDGKWNSSTVFRYTGAMVDHIGAKLNCCSSNDTKFPGASS